MNPCCQVLENRTPPEQLSEAMSFTSCRVCGAKHYELVVEEGDLVLEEVDL